MSQRDGSVSNLIVGAFIIFGLHLLALLALGLITWIGGLIKIDSLQIPLLVHTYGVGITQLIYVIPLIIYYRKQQKYGLMKGVIVGAVITALLNGGCWFYLFSVLK
jgi:uncharacterized BrkB/YihY/UPF0761 family membrane protein